MESNLNEIRILRIISRMNVGGPALQICGISKNLNKEKFHELLLTGFCDENEVDFLTEMDSQMPVVRIPGFGRKVSILSDGWAFFTLLREILKYRPHIVHTHTTKAGVLGRIASIMTFQGHKRVHTYHGHLLFGYFPKFATHLLTILERVLASQTDVLISVGSKVRDDLLNAQIGNAHKYRVVPPGLELTVTESQVEARNALGLQINATYFMWIGRVVSIKNPLRVLRIAEILKGINPLIRICVAGDGPLLSEMLRITNNLKLPIDFLGWQSNIERVLAASDGLILTSINEGTPLSLIQAQMAGKPVISTDVGSVAEVVENHRSGFVGDFDDQQFAELILMLSKDSTLRQEMGAFGREFALKRFSVKRLVNDHENIYRGLIN
jgi:glycosyltransferase involved in cell wall biosynthesis